MTVEFCSVTFGVLTEDWHIISSVQSRAVSNVTCGFSEAMEG